MRSPVSLTDSTLLLASVSTALLSVDAVDLPSLRFACIQRLKDLGVVHDARFAHHKRILDWFSQSAVSRMLAASRSNISALADGRWIASQLVRRRSSHSVRWVVLWAALEEKRAATAAEAFLAACSGYRSNSASQFQLFADEPIKYAAPDEVWRCLQQSDSYDAAMRSLSASKHDIGRWLDADPDLRRAWKARLREARLIRAKDALARYVDQNPQASTNDLDDHCESEVRWLRTNAPSELRAVRNGLTSRGARQKDLFASVGISF